MSGRAAKLRQSTGRRRCLVHLSVLGAALVALLSTASAEAATVTVGPPSVTATSFPSALSTGSQITLYNSALSEAGANVSSPVTGTVVRWRITGAAGGPFELRVLASGGGGTYTGAGTSAAQTPASSAPQTYPTDLPIRAGETIGLDLTPGSQLGDHGGASVALWQPPLVDGAPPRSPSGNLSIETGFNADVQPLPSVSSLSPSSGPSAGGTAVTITGSNFEGTTAVSFGSTPARSFTVMSDNVITAVTPASAAGTVDVTAKNPGQSAVSASDRFTFATPPVAVKCTVPKLKGKTLKKARKLLKRAHCKLGKVKGPKNKTARIKKQRPKPGKVLNAGSKVKVTTRRRH